MILNDGKREHMEQQNIGGTEKGAVASIRSWYNSLSVPHHFHAESKWLRGQMIDGWNWDSLWNLQGILTLSVIGLPWGSKN